MTETLTPSFPSEVDEAVEWILKEACAQQLRLATAESCTGGLLASLLTDISGCSHAFDRGFVVYTNEAKHEMLGVSRELLDSSGPVSEPAARAMAEGALARSHADIAVAVTGYAGQAGPRDPPGLVHFSLARRNKPTLHRLEQFGDIGRGEVRRRSIETALEMLRDALRRN